jgi:hypothetical protein
MNNLDILPEKKLFTTCTMYYTINLLDTHEYRITNRRNNGS